MNDQSIEKIHKNKTGKVSDKWESYLPFYDELFAKYREQNISLLEIGVQNGGSLETWHTFFRNAAIFIGCDIDERCGNLLYDDARINIVTGDANLSDTTNKIIAICDKFDIIIDDGSHRSNDILNSFSIYFQLLKPGGIYVVEDTHTLYMNDWGGGILNDTSTYQFFKKIVDVVNYQFWHSELSLDIYFRTFFPLGQLPSFIKDGWIESIEFRNSLIIIKKSLSATHSKLGEHLFTGSIKPIYG